MGALTQDGQAARHVQGLRHGDQSQVQGGLPDERAGLGGGDHCRGMPVREVTAAIVLN
jgi:hypothetical protein